MTDSFGWLHLTDFHRGMTDQKWLWPRIKQKFFDDLQELHEESGPWDLVLFTGDLAQKGDATEFERVDLLLSECWDLFAKCGSTPALLAVPGNHDLVRPPEDLPEVILLKQWLPVQEKFWKDSGSPYRRVIDDAFVPYVEWWNAQTLRPAIVHDGLMPGDFASTIPKGELKIGILGINTTFLQLTEGNYKGQLSAHSQQFQDACGGDGPSWARQHHACLLLTHQPLDWLRPEAQAEFNSEISDAGQFALHLFGHMHEPFFRTVAIGGGKPRNSWQGRSLCGLEYFDDGGGKEIRRSHGYSAGRLNFQGLTGSVTLWPREARRGQDDTWKFVPDQSYELQQYVHTAPIEFPLLTPYKAASPSKNGDSRQIRMDMLAARSPREMREALYRVDALLESLQKTDARRHDAQSLRDEILHALGKERPLRGLHRVS